MRLRQAVNEATKDKGCGFEQGRKLQDSSIAPRAKHPCVEEERPEGSPTQRLPLLQDVERGQGRPISPSMRTGCMAVMKGMSWHKRAQRRLDDYAWLLQKIYGGQIPGLAAALVHKCPDPLTSKECTLAAVQAHLESTVSACKDLIREHLLKIEHTRQQGTVEMCQVLAGNVEALCTEEILAAYGILAAIVLKIPVHMRAPVRYNEDLRRKLTAFGMNLGESTACAGLESRHSRNAFDMTQVLLEGVRALHVAVDFDAQELRAGNSAVCLRQLLEAKADVNVMAYYQTEAMDFREHGRRLRVAVSPIHLAVERESIELVALLLQHKASPETRAVFDMRADYTPLHLAAAKGLEGIAHLLIEAGGNPAETDLSGKNCHQVLAPHVSLPPGPKWTLISEEEDLQGGSQDRLGLSSRPTTEQPSISYCITGVTEASLSSVRSNGAETFQACAHALLRLPGDATAEELRQVVAENLDGAGINDLFLHPLPEGRFYKRSKVLLQGSFIHFAIDMAVRLEEQGRDQPEAILRLVLRASADVHARAHYYTWGISHTCTAVHLAAAGGAPATLALLLDAGASVEAMVTNDTKPHYTPLLDAASEGHYEACKLLLARKANPNVPNRLGRTCLHNAVLDGRGSLASLLAEGKSDVSLADSIFGETPLLCTSRAKGGKYPVSDMLCLCRAYHCSSKTSRLSLLYDLSSLASCREKLTSELLDYVLHNPPSDEPEVSEKKAQLLEQMRRVCVDGRPDEHGVTPVDQIATIIECAPRAGVRLLADVLMTVPDVEDATHGTLPVYANLQTGRFSWFPWRRCLGNVEPLLTDYEPDAKKRRDGREWPCWLFDSTRPDAEPPWHRHFAHTPSKRYVIGNHMVQVKVLLLANVLNPNILHALAGSWELEIFAEMPVRALISFAYFHLVRDLLLFEKVLEIISIFALVTWARNGEPESFHIRRLCWVWCAAVSMQECVVRLWKLRRYLSLGWNLKGLLQGFENAFAPIIQVCHWPFLIICAQGDLTLDTDGDHRGVLRVLIGIAIILRSFKLIMLFRYGDMFGSGILAVYNALRGVFTMLTIMTACFLTFAMAYFVMRKEDTNSSDLLVRVYRGLMLGDDDSLEEMGQAWGGEVGNALMIFGTGVFTVYLLNIMIAVLTAEYYKADREAPLILWRERAFKSAQALLGPVLPWTLDSVKNAVQPLPGLMSPSRARTVVTAPAAAEHSHSSNSHGDIAASSSSSSSGCCSPLCSAISSFAACLCCLSCGRRSASDDETHCQQDQEARDAAIMGRLADLAVLVLLGTTVCLFTLPVHVVWPAVALGPALVLFQSRLLRGRFVGTKRRGKRFFLWVCHRSDYTHLNFVSEEVEKEHIDQLKDKVEHIDDLLRDLHRRVVGFTNPVYAARSPM